MPQYGTQDYKSAVFEQLSKGTSGENQDDDHFEHFDNFSKSAPRRTVEEGVGEAFHPERADSSEIEPELRTAAEKMEPHERSEVAHDLMGELEKRGLAPSWLQKLLGLGGIDPAGASADDVAKLSEYARQNHPEVFRQVVADKPFFVRWMSKPLVGALVGIIAGKMLNRQYDK